MDRWDSPTTRILILTLGTIAVLWIFATKFDESQLKVIGGLVSLYVGDKYNLHSKVWKLIRGKKKTDDATGAAAEDDGEEEETEPQQ